MTHLTPARRTAALIALALGGFAIGSTEFVAMGLLPNIAEALLPRSTRRTRTRASRTPGGS